MLHIHKIFRNKYRNVIGLSSVRTVFAQFLKRSCSLVGYNEEVSADVPPKKLSFRFRIS